MPIHQADLLASKTANERVDRKAIEAYLQGQGSLADGLSLTPENILSLRRQALALLEAGKWQRAIDVVLGLVALGNIHPADPAILARCYMELGQTEMARVCGEHADAMIEALGLVNEPTASESAPEGR